MLRTVLLFCLLFIGTQLLAQDENFPELRLGWTLAIQSFTFKKFTFSEAVDKTKEVGLKYIEAFPGQRISRDGDSATMNYDMSTETRSRVKELLSKKGVKLIAYGVVKCYTEADWEKLFEFAADMGIQIITTEPEDEFLPLVGKLADRYHIKVAIHNHPAPTKYWHPDIVLAAIKKANSENVGACADIGHWTRSGLNPLECLKAYKGKIFNMHFKDVNLATKEGHSVVWGTGVGKIREVVRELIRLGFKGNISVEYEYNWDNNVEDVAKSVAFFRSLIK